jgi:hypothetical protein
VRDVPYGPPSRAEDELGFREGVQALRRAVSSLSRLPDGGNRADLCQARGLADASVMAPGIGVGPIAGERETGVERTPAEPGHLEGPEDRLDRHLRGDLPADDPAPRGVEERDVGHPFGGADGGLVRDSARPPPDTPPFHPDQLVVAEPGRTLVPRDHRQEDPPRIVHRRERPDRRHRGLHRTPERRSQAIQVDQTAEEIIEKVRRGRVALQALAA